MKQIDHLDALAGLRRINRVSRAADHILLPIVDLISRQNPRRLSMLDIACGGGDVPISVAQGIQRLGVQVDLTLLDRSATAIQQAGNMAAAQGIACRGVQADAIGELPYLPADVITNSLFLHHVEEPEKVVALLARMREMARRMVVISDLRRSRRGWVAAWTGCRLLSRSRIVHHDGPASVRAAWTLHELSRFAENAGMEGVKIHSCWPFRLLLVWERDRGTGNEPGN
jgi:2-polyprenyl-3-methyl-5-hydroxy-6-metoxy-1,4-benzoquinol methylase